MKKNYTQLSFEQRNQIEALLQTGRSQKEIAQQIGVHPSVSTPKMQTFESREIPLISKTMKKSRFTEVHSYRPVKSMNPV